MNDHVYKTVEITGSSTTSVEDAVKLAIDRAASTIKNMRWFKVTEIRGAVDNGKVGYWQVTIQLGFTLE